MLQEEISFPMDTFLEEQAGSSARECLEAFHQKGGAFQSISTEDFLHGTTRIHLQDDDAVYPICTGGFCRSQSLWGLLLPYSSKIVLFPPHAARKGWDPYNGQINRFLNYTREKLPDHFHVHFKREKALRFGFENVPHWKSVEETPSTEGLQRITEFYNHHYFGEESSWEGRKGKRRIYIAFSRNAHVVMHRLNQANHILSNVTLIAIDIADIITHPGSLPFEQRSAEAYAHFTHLLSNIVEFGPIWSAKALPSL